MHVILSARAGRKNAPKAAKPQETAPTTESSDS
jgi:hypothetical protein